MLMLTAQRRAEAGEVVWMSIGSLILCNITHDDNDDDDALSSSRLVVKVKERGQTDKTRLMNHIRMSRNRHCCRWLYLSERSLPFSPRARRLVPCCRCALIHGSAHRHRPLICHSLPVKGQSVSRPETHCHARFSR